MDRYDADQYEREGWATLLIAGLIELGSFEVICGRLPSLAEATTSYSFFFLLVVWFAVLITWAMIREKSIRGALGYLRVGIYGENSITVPGDDACAQSDLPREPELVHGEEVELSSADGEGAAWMDESADEPHDPGPFTVDKGIHQALLLGLEDTSGVWELLWKLNTRYPDYPDAERREAVWITIGLCLELGWITLFRSSEPHGELEEVPPSGYGAASTGYDWEWNGYEPFPDMVYLHFSTTDAGERAFNVLDAPPPIH